jgi:outer membrane immunogenic protein
MRQLFPVIVGVVALSGVAAATDLPVKAPMPVKAPPIVHQDNWTGFYVGAQAGYGRTTQSMSATEPAALVATYGAVPSPKGFTCGVRGGYDMDCRTAS